MARMGQPYDRTALDDRRIAMRLAAAAAQRRRERFCEAQWRALLLSGEAVA